MKSESGVQNLQSVNVDSITLQDYITRGACLQRYMICQSWVNLPLGKDSVIYYTNLKSISLQISQGNDCVRTFTAQSIKTTNRPSNKKKKKESAGGESRQYKEGRPFHNPFPHLESVRQNNKITATLFMPPWFRERRESQSRLPMYCTLLPRPLLKT